MANLVERFGVHTAQPADADSSLEGGWEEVRTNVEIKFDLTLDEVANKTVDNFDAIKPTGPIGGNYRACFGALLETVRKVVLEKRELKTGKAKFRGRHT